jgi:ABC-type dipeptide/oligopeptide/nickel transport system ATPase component
MSLLEIKNYSVVSNKENEESFILKDINFFVNESDTLAIIGESGSGKSTIAKSIISLLDKNLKVKEGEIFFEEKNIFNLSDEEKRLLRRDKISFLPQESLNVLDPLVKIGQQISEIISHDKSFTKQQRKNIVLKMLNDCAFKELEEIWHKYPFELSGGNRQKILFAIATISKPKLLIADEPTSSLDFESKNEILNLLTKFKETNKNTLIFITHDIVLASKISNRMIVLKSGEIVESGLTADIFNNPKEKYTQMLTSNTKI